MITGVDVGYGGAGADRIDSRFRAFGGDGDDNLTGAIVGGEAGADIITGRGSFADLRGGDGNDQITGAGGSDRFDGGAGDDVLRSTGANGREIFFGGDGNDQVFAGGEGDVVFGGEGADILSGDAGNDVLTGEAGADRLTGGLGADRFRYVAVSDSTALERDLITDFSTGAFTAAGQARLTYNFQTFQTLFEGDVDGDGTADIVILINFFIGTGDGFVL